jgi:hypothetical protein
VRSQSGVLRVNMKVRSQSEVLGVMKVRSQSEVLEDQIMKLRVLSLLEKLEKLTIIFSKVSFNNFRVPL